MGGDIFSRDRKGPSNREGCREDMAEDPVEDDADAAVAMLILDDE